MAHTSMMIRSQAPLRLGIAGGGTDISPYSDTYGGAILNATINMYAYATIEPLSAEDQIVLHAVDIGKKKEYQSSEQLELDGDLSILKGVYNRIVNEFVKHPLSFKLTTWVDAPPGSGLGSSSTLVVAIIGAFAEWLNLPLGEYDIARLAFEIERVDLNFSGGKQDQYAATFGGFNFMEFYDNDKVIVNPLRIKRSRRKELELNLVLYHTEVSRVSSDIIDQQVSCVNKDQEKLLEAMHKVKQTAYKLKESILTGKMNLFGPDLHDAWLSKKATAKGISNDLIETAFDTALQAGATGGKVSGAGGGGFIVFYCPLNTRHDVIRRLQNQGGSVKPFLFSDTGLTTWRV